LTISSAKRCRQALTLIGALPILGWRSSVEPRSRDVTIVAHEYAFTAPATLAAGLTTFHFVNRGRVTHEVQLFRFKPRRERSDRAPVPCKRRRSGFRR